MGLSSKGSGRGLQENPGGEGLVRLTSEEHCGRGQRQLHRHPRAAQSASTETEAASPAPGFVSQRASSAWPHTIESPAGGGATGVQPVGAEGEPGSPGG